MLCLLGEQRGRRTGGPTHRPGVGSTLHVAS
jgi:hypothetical protein